MWTMIALSHVTQHNIESLYPMSKGLKDPAALSFYTMLSPRQPGRKERVMSPRPQTPSVQMLQMPRLSWTQWNFHLKQRRKRRPTKATRKKGKSQESMSSQSLGSSQSSSDSECVQLIKRRKTNVVLGDNDDSLPSIDKILWKRHKSDTKSFGSVTLFSDNLNRLIPLQTPGEFLRRTNHHHVEFKTRTTKNAKWR